MWAGLIHIYAEIFPFSGSVMGASGISKLHLQSVWGPFGKALGQRRITFACT